MLPARVEFLHNIYGVPKNKIELLVMGADDEMVEKYSNSNSVENERKKFKLKKTDFVVVTGGKIDFAKTQIFNLMNVVNKMDSNIKLIIFGSVME